MRPAIAGAAIAILVAHAPTTGADGKLTVADVVAKHVASLGWRDVQAAQALRVAQGACRFEIRRGGAGILEGRTRIASEGRRFRVELPFGSSEYYGESFAYDGTRVEVGFIQPRQRSPLGEFLNTYDGLVREGLLSGVLSTAWPLLELSGRGATVKYEGLKRVEDRPLHQLAYKAAKSQGEVQVRLFFDPETFQHVRTTYKLWLLPSMAGVIERTASQQDVRFEIVETFASFESAAGLTLPKQWTLTFHMDGPSTNALWRWDSVIEKVSATSLSPP